MPVSFSTKFNAQGLGLHHLRCFLETFDRGSLSAAARFLEQGQPNISYHLQMLEKSLQLHLFERDNHKAIIANQLTPAGKALLPKARYVMSLVDEIHQFREQNASNTPHAAELPYP